MLKYLPYAIQALALVGGGAAGVLIKTAGGAPENGPIAEEAPAKAEGEGGAHAAASEKAPGEEARKAENKPGKEAKAKNKGGGHGAKEAPGEGYMRFGRQFIVPVIGPNGVKSLIAMDINLEVPPSESETIYQSEPKIRDALLSTLLKLSNEGAFSGEVFDEGNLDAIRAELLESARSVVGEDALSVLILGFTRQDI